MIDSLRNDEIPDDTRLLCDDCGHLTTVELAEQAADELGERGDWCCPACGFCNMELV
jgi:TPP-dependent indolepyruvate ferredoxin oxidoreductase alpha subunit